ncbi:MAG: carbamoyltransferase C-terminal domain-containing protein [Pseudonocardiaceae bacterium]
MFAVGQERVTRRKYDGGFVESARYALDAVGISISEVKTVAISTFGQPDAIGDPEHAEVERVVRNVLGDGPSYQVVPSHHLAHALSAAAQCPYERALIAVIDNEGSILGPRAFRELWRHGLERTSYYLLDGENITLVARDHDGPGEVGYGKAYSKVTRFVGFRSYQESGKTMALAAFGDPGRFGTLRLFQHESDGRAHTAMRNSADGLRDLAEFFSDAGCPLPPPRRPGERLDPAHIDLAAWCQVELEESVGQRIHALAKEHHIRAFCGAGGVFLNSVMNRRLQDRLDTGDVFVPPSPGDQGLALGAAAWLIRQSTGKLPRWTPRPYLGGQFDDDAIETELARHPDLNWEKPADHVLETVRDVAAGCIVGWFQGRSEYGPRALGNRSILANPTDPWSREVLNNLVKRREWFRPYAPVAVEERAGKTFDLRSPVPFMMHIAPTRPEAVAELPGGVHVDKSARLQTVRTDQNAVFHRLVTEFADLTGSSAILNTSLNIDGMPIVESPADGIECFRSSPGMDALFLGSMKVTRSKAKRP